MSEATTSPFIRPSLDESGRRDSETACYVLEIGINILEQHDVLTRLITSRVVDGVAENLLFTAFESWLVTEHRKRGFNP